MIPSQKKKLDSYHLCISVFFHFLRTKGLEPVLSLTNANILYLEGCVPPSSLLFLAKSREGEN